VFSGMIGVALFGIFLTPVFYFVLMRFGSRELADTSPVPQPTAAAIGDGEGRPRAPAEASPPPPQSVASQRRVQEFGEHTPTERQNRRRWGAMSTRIAVPLHNPGSRTRTSRAVDERHGKNRQ
jgi:hypothetical protein